MPYYNSLLDCEKYYNFYYHLTLSLIYQTFIIIFNIIMKSSFTSYAQNFMQFVSPNGKNHQEINVYLNNGGVIVQKQENYLINNNILVINKFDNNLNTTSSKMSGYKNRKEKEKFDINDLTMKQKEDEIINYVNRKDFLNKEFNNRQDVFGNPISKLKQHKVTFSDKIPHKKKILVEIVEVTSYKKYNIDNTFNDEQKNVFKCTTNPLTCCILF
jgi:hypothetical protein